MKKMFLVPLFLSVLIFSDCGISETLEEYNLNKTMSSMRSQISSLDHEVSLLRESVNRLSNQGGNAINIESNVIMMKSSLEDLKRQQQYFQLSLDKISKQQEEVNSRLTAIEVEKRAEITSGNHSRPISQKNEYDKLFEERDKVIKDK